MSPKILSSGLSKIFRGKGHFRNHRSILDLFSPILRFEGQAKVAAIRFSLTSLSDVRKFARESEGLLIRYNF